MHVHINGLHFAAKVRLSNGDLIAGDARPVSACAPKCCERWLPSPDALVSITRGRKQPPPASRGCAFISPRVPRRLQKWRRQGVEIASHFEIGIAHALKAFLYNLIMQSFLPGVSGFALGAIE